MNLVGAAHEISQKCYNNNPQKNVNKCHITQWQIQDFSDEGVPIPEKKCSNLFFRQNLAKKNA